MLTRYWQPLREMETLRRDFDRMFNELAVPASSGSVIDWTPAIEPSTAVHSPSMYSWAGLTADSR